MRGILKIGKKVGVIRFDIETNTDSIEVGKIVGRRINFMGLENIDMKYAVKFDDGRIEEYNYCELWKTKKGVK